MRVHLFVKTIAALSLLMSFNAAYALANPASTHCINKGGTLKIADTPQGQVGYCTLPDKTVCEEWAFFRGQCPAAKSKPVRPNQPGSFNNISTSDPEVRKVANFAAQQISRGKATVKRVIQAKSQVVAGKNYRLLIDLSNGGRYAVTVFKPLGNRPLQLSSVNQLAH
ncbi:DUF333 domain-containing protein [Thiolinea disciformis]|uniref:DUF333 domain-containing protein n=1 Tax=Thiolinea disciformis TaxID=125614 RepID=UPI0003773A93|nr:DUF333 domain-containing protein [Thiolinea disciformis]